jgi:aminoglycoside phosphotransferase (APT) family kinase protein
VCGQKKKINMAMDIEPFVDAAGLTDVIEAGGGVEFLVFRATSARHGTVALRVARCQIYQNVNDPFIEAERLLRQEMRICRHLEGTEIPVPRHFGILERQGRVAALSAFVEADDSTASDTEMGRVLSLLHRLPPPTGPRMVAQEGLETMQVLPRRIARRWREMQKLVPACPDLVPVESLTTLCDAIALRHQKCLLHMDFRPDNFRVRNGEIVALMDWSNALVGPAAVDLYRVLELVKPGPDFLRSYRALCSPVPLSEAEETVLRLDAAVMLALVFLSEAPDPGKAPEWVRRVRALNGQLLNLLGESTV